MTDVAAASSVQSAASPPSTAAQSHGLSLWAHGSFSFKDLLDIVNPLQHLPVIGSVYRYLTGDEPSGGARIVGDAIYGGPIGFGAGVVSTMLTDDDGRDLGERALAAVFGRRDDRDKPTAVAKAPATSTPSTATPSAQAQTVQPAIAAAQASQAQPGNPTQLATQLYRSPPVSTSTTPEQSFLAQNAQFQRQLPGGRADTGPVLNSRPVPLQLTGNPMPGVQPKPMPATRPGQPAAAVAPPVAAASDTVTNPIAQKMFDALDKYERLKKKQEQGDSATDKAPSGVDLTL